MTADGVQVAAVSSAAMLAPRIGGAWLLVAVAEGAAQVIETSVRPGGDGPDLGSTTTAVPVKKSADRVAPKGARDPPAAPKGQAANSRIALAPIFGALAVKASIAAVKAVFPLDSASPGAT